MALQIFNTENMTKRPGELTIRFYRNGKTTISKAMVDEFELEPGDTVSLIQDDEEPENWYLLYGHKLGFPLHKPGNKSGLEFNSAAMANAFLDALDIPDNSVAFKVARNAAEEMFQDTSSPAKKMPLYAIFTSNPIK